MHTITDPTTQKVNSILDKHFSQERDYSVSNIKPLASNVPSMKIYLLDISCNKSEPCLSFLTLSEPTTSNSHNSLPTILYLIDLVRNSTPLPLTPPILDTTLSIIPYQYLISTPVPNSTTSLILLSEATSKLHLSPKETSIISLKIGQLLGTLHSLVQNDWFGKPSPGLTPPTNPSYSWQETFVSIFENAVQRTSASYPDILSTSMKDILNQHMSRAIAFFLFDDVQVPSLIWFTGSPTDVYLTLKSLPDGTQSLELAALVPNLAHALWGDPLLETFFIDSSSAGSSTPPDPNFAALLEGYIAGGGEPLLTFPRHKTKRIWYTLYLAFTLLCDQGGEERKVWAVGIIEKCIAQLHDAPVY